MDTSTLLKTIAIVPLVLAAYYFAIWFTVVIVPLMVVTFIGVIVYSILISKKKKDDYY